MCYTVHTSVQQVRICSQVYISSTITLCSGGEGGEGAAGAAGAASPNEFSLKTVEALAAATCRLKASLVSLQNKDVGVILRIWKLSENSWMTSIFIQLSTLEKEAPGSTLFLYQVRWQR